MQLWNGQTLFHYLSDWLYMHRKRCNNIIFTIYQIEGEGGGGTEVENPKQYRNLLLF